MPLNGRDARRLRPIVLGRDGNVCQLNIAGVCRSRGRPLPDDQLDVHHIIESRAGGTDALSNLATACKPCNAHASGGQNQRQRGGAVTL